MRPRKAFFLRKTPARRGHYGSRGELQNHARGDKEMKKIFWIVPAILMLSLTARAQEAVGPAWEISGGYSYLRGNLGNSSFPRNGATASRPENLNSWVGGRVEIAAYHGNEAGNTVSAETVTY